MTCFETCPVGAIEPARGTAEISQDTCIRCGKCHSVCPVGAVRHDSEQIPAEVEANIQWVQSIVQHEFYADPKTHKGLMRRMRNYFRKQSAVAEQTLERLNALQTGSTEPASGV